jgi:hypothetical protein
MTRFGAEESELFLLRKAAKALAFNFCAFPNHNRRRNFTLSAFLQKSRARGR